MLGKVKSRTCSRFRRKGEAGGDSFGGTPVALRESYCRWDAKIGKVPLAGFCLEPQGFAEIWPNGEAWVKSGINYGVKRTDRFKRTAT
ncbi:MAG: hypothetical protein LBR80_13780 [Deltaproteobacteria bacterium]|jgi:hypothetical protein|nr:hypothetical protein [Deltaproteobacteria bacterium]